MISKKKANKKIYPTADKGSTKEEDLENGKDEGAGRRRGHDEFHKNLRAELKKFLPYTQKAVILKLLAIEDEGNGSDQSKKEGTMKNAETLVQGIKDAMINSYANLGVLSALVGITTYAAVLAPLVPSTIDIPIHGFSTAGIRACSVLNMCSTCCSLVTICLATSYIYIVSNLLITNEDLVWFMVNVESVFHCFVGCVLAVLLALAALLTSASALYSLPTANISIIVGTCILGLYFFLLGPVIRKVFAKIDERVKASLEDAGDASEVPT